MSTDSEPTNQIGSFPRGQFVQCPFDEFVPAPARLVNGTLHVPGQAQPHHPAIPRILLAHQQFRLDQRTDEVDTLLAANPISAATSFTEIPGRRETNRRNSACESLIPG